MKKQLTIAGFVIVTGIAVWLIMTKSQMQEQRTVIAPKEELNVSQMQKIQPQKSVETLSVKSVEEKSAPKEEVLARSVSFELLDSQAAEIAIKKKSKVEPISGFSYEQGAVKKLNIGDTLLMPDIENVRYELKVTQKTLNSDGSVTIETSVENGEPSNYAIITEAQNATFVTLRAPGTVYEMEGVGGTGYIYSALEIKRAKIDYSVTDAMIPPKNHKD